MSLHILIHCILRPRPRFSNALGTQTKSVDWLFVPAAGKASKHWHAGMNCFGHTPAWLPMMPSFAGTAHTHDGIPELSSNRYGHMTQAGLIRFFFLKSLDFTRMVLWTELCPPKMHNGEGNGNLLQYSCLENLMDRGAWWATVHGVAKSQTQLSNQHFHFQNA